MCICICVYVYMYMYICLCIYVYVYMYMYVCICICICIYVYMYICIYVYMYMYMYMYLHMHMYMYIYMHMYIYIYIYMHSTGRRNCVQSMQEDLFRNIWGDQQGFLRSCFRSLDETTFIFYAQAIARRYSLSPGVLASYADCLLGSTAGASKSVGSGRAVRVGLYESGVQCW